MWQIKQDFKALNVVTKSAGPILGIGGMGAFLRVHFLKKGHFVCSHPLSRCHF